MNPAPKPTVKAALHPFLRLSMEEAKRSIADYALFRGYCGIWKWASVKLGGPAERDHDAFFLKFGARAYYARINKVRAACGFAPISVDGVLPA